MTTLRVIVVIGLTILADQVTKAIALSTLSYGNPVPVLPGFSLTLGFNEGASFGLLGGAMAGKPLLMAAMTGVITLIFAVMAFRARHPLERLGLALVVGGALGNIADRLRQGAVTDFIDLYWQDWHWPTFNVADIGITMGALCILISILPSRRRKGAVLDRR
ncbi:MAG: signal peptidase II [Cereibacter sphaeroides]|uniref:Lipoprotein signal peptidase n=1 Tax=Cereibacter sphaeroides TaxID=1063 RepID=A0A2W5USZ2_CERSP|nr:MAG: signal peptidase II [Cereibacter sphaeroides]